MPSAVSGDDNDDDDDCYYDGQPPLPAAQMPSDANDSDEDEADFEADLIDADAWHARAAATWHALHPQHSEMDAGMLLELAQVDQTLVLQLGHALLGRRTRRNRLVRNRLRVCLPNDASTPPCQLVHVARRRRRVR